MAHPVVDAHLAHDGFDFGGEETTASGPGTGANRTPQTVATFAAVALIGIVLLRVSGFRFAVGGQIGG